MVINECQLCGGKLKKIFSLGKQPLCDDLIKIGSKKKNKLYKTDIIFCKNCIIAYNKYLVDPEKLFPKSYHYRAGLTQDVLNGMKNLVFDSSKILKGLKNKKVLDIGCNDGSLLNFFKKKGAITLGVEPTNACKKIKKHQIYNDFFSKKIALRIKKKYSKIDLIVFTNVFAHINDFKNLIKNLKIIISENTKIIIENHYLGSVIERNQFDTFYHEHPRTYSLNSFLIISKLLNMNLINFSLPKRYGGNIRIVFANKKSSNVHLKMKKTLIEEKKIFRKFLAMEHKIRIWKMKITKQLSKLKKKNFMLVGKAFPGRASILINYLKLDKRVINKIYEKPNSLKIGYYVPNTNIPIVSDNELKKLEKDTIIINFAWHIDKEINQYLKAKNIKNKIINIL